MSHSPVHLNGNIMCAIDIETSGLVPGFHDIWQIAIIPVAPNLEVNKQLRYFTAKMQLRRPQNVDPQAMSQNQIADVTNNGSDSDRVEERLREWFESLPLLPGKRIVPLGHNYANHDRPFIMDWLGGPASYQEFFRSDHRDTMTFALMLNDVADWHNEKIPFPKWGLNYLCRYLGFPQEGAHDAIMDALTTIEVYRKMMRYRDDLMVFQGDKVAESPSGE